MAARTKRPFHNDKTREKIRTSQLLNRLTNYALGGVDPKTKKPIEMTSAQVSAALGVLKKALPDLAAIEHTGEVSTRDVSELTRDEILGRIEALRASAGNDGRQAEPDSVH